MVGTAVVRERACGSSGLTEGAPHTHRYVDIPRQPPTRARSPTCTVRGNPGVSSGFKTLSATDLYIVGDDVEAQMLWGTLTGWPVRTLPGCRGAARCSVAFWHRTYGQFITGDQSI